MRIRHESLRKMVMEDVTKTGFSCTRDLDPHGRLETMVMNIKGYEQFRLKLDYNSANQLSRQTVTIARGSPTSQSFSYNKNNQIERVKGDGNNDWTFTHDVNGNVISVTRAEGSKIVIGKKIHFLLF